MIANLLALLYINGVVQRVGCFVIQFSVEANSMTAGDGFALLC